MKITNKDLIQSYIITTAKYDYSVYEKRILYRIIEMMQGYTQGKQLSKRYHITKTLFDDIDVIMPVSAFLKDEKDNNYKRAKDALLSLNQKRIIYEDDKTWGAFNLIERPTVDKIGDCVSFRVSPTIAKAFLDFSKGFSKYELKTAMQFESVYAMRFYELLSGQKHPITYAIDKIKTLFQIEDKYNRVNNFFAKVIDPAKKELDDKSPYSFEYEKLKTGRAITAIRFYPVYQPQNRDENIEALKLGKTVSLSWTLSRITVTYLKENYFFTNDEIKNNRTLFEQAEKSPEFDLLNFLSVQKRNAAEKKNPKGWIINSIKKQLEQKIQKHSSKVKKTQPESRNTETMSVKDILKGL